MRWRPQVVSSRIAKEAHKFRLPHSAGSNFLPISVLKLGGAFLDFYLDHVTSTRNHLRGSSLIAWDRYFHDIAVDSERYRYHGPEWYPELLARLLPVPSRFVGIVLDAAEDIVLRRKRELPPEEIRRQRSHYQQLASKLPRTYIVKNERTMEACVHEVLSIAIDNLANWFQPYVTELLQTTPNKAVVGTPVQLLAG
jgi:hypothetical protein